MADRREELTDHERILLLEFSHAELERRVRTLDGRLWAILLSSVATLFATLGSLAMHH